MATSAELITQLYVGYYNRAPDPAGLNYWVGIYNSGQSITQIAEYFALQDESKAAYPYLANPNIADPNTFVNTIYQNLFNRAATDADKAYWVGELQAGRVTAGAFIATIQYSANTAGTGDDFNTLKNKTTVAQDYAVDLANAGVAFTQASAKDVISGVTKDAASVTAGMAKTDAFIAGGGASSQTLTLSTGIDTWAGGSGSDLFDATKGAAGAATLTGLDNLDGAGGVDTLKATQLGALTVPVSATVKNIEVVELVSDTSVTADVQSWTGLQSLKATTPGAVDVDTKANATSVSVVGGTTVAVDDNGTAATDTLASVSLDGNTGVAALKSDKLTTVSVANSNQDVTITNATAAHTLNLTVNKLTGGIITDAVATKVAVTSTGSASTGATLTAGLATSVTFAGSAALSLAAAGTVAATAAFDASASTGGVTITDALATGQVFTGGAGKDTVTIGATTKAIVMGAGDDTVNVSVAALGSGGSATGGDGTDTLGFVNFANAVTASGATTFASSATGFEVLSLNGVNAAAGATINLANLNATDKNAIAKVIYAATNTETSTITNLASGNTVEFTASQTDGKAATLTVKDAVAGTADVLNVSLKGAATVNAFDVDISNVETINFLTDDTATVPTGIAHSIDLVAAAAKTITVTGDAGLTITTATGTALTSFDASGVTKGAVSVTTGALAAAATLKGGAGDDTINAGAATKAVTIEGGAGNDTITGSATVGSTLTGGDGNDTINGGAGADTVNGGAGDDTINSGAGLDIIDVGAGNNTFVVTANSNGNTYATLTGMDKGDKIDFVAGGGAAAFTTAKISLADTAAFADYLQASAAGGADRVVWFQFGGNTYLVQDVTAGAVFTNGADQVVKLTGLVDLSTATIDGAGTNILTLG